MADEGHLAGQRLALGDLVLVVGEDEVGAAAVDVDLVAEGLADHRGALDVPPGPTFAPWAVPRWLIWLGGLPQGKISGVLLAWLELLAGCDQLTVQVTATQLAILGECGDREPDVAVVDVGVLGFDQVANEFDDLLHVAGDGRVLVGSLHIEPIHHGEIRIRVFLGSLSGGATLTRSALDDLVVDVGEVLNVLHFETAVVQVATHHIERDEGARVADVGVEFGGHAAGVDAQHAVRGDGDELIPAAAHDSAVARAKRIAERCGPRRGSSHTMVRSAFSSCQASASSDFQTVRRRSVLRAPRQRGSVDGKCEPMSPWPVAPSRASISACTAASPSEWPARPRSCGMCTPPSHSGTPCSKAWTSMPLPTLITPVAYVRARSRAGW